MPSRRTARPNKQVWRHLYQFPLTIIAQLDMRRILTYPASLCDVFDTGLAIKCLEKAANLFKMNERGGSRAAKVYNQLGDLLKGQDIKKAAEMYREAAELFKSDGDG